MALTDFEIGKIAEIVAGRVGTELDAKTLRQVIDRVVDAMKDQQGNPTITGVTCDISASSRSDFEQSKKPDISTQVSDKGGLYEQIKKTDGNRIIVAAFGNNRPGIVAALTQVLSENACSIEDISQTLLQEFFSMIMIVGIEGCNVDFATLKDRLAATESQYGMKVYVMHEDIFKFMHRI